MKILRIALFTNLLSFAAWMGSASSVSADDLPPDRIAIESHSGPRPSEARRAMAMLRVMLAKHRFVAQPAALRKLIGDSVPMPVAADRDFTTRAFSSAVDEAENLYINESYKDAAIRLQAALARVHRNPLILRDVQSRDLRLKGLVLLALSYGRLSSEQPNKDAQEHARARDEALLEIQRSYPSRVITAKQFGPEAVRLARAVTDTIEKGGRGRLAIEVNDPDVLIYVNEIPRGHSRVVVGDLVPGSYRILLQPASGLPRTFSVDVSPSHEARLTVDWDVASVLVADGDYVGFNFDTEVARKRDGELARRFARAQGGIMVAVLSADLSRRRLVIIGSLYAVESGRLVRHGLVELGKHDDASRLEHLAAYLDPSMQGANVGKVSVLENDTYVAAPLPAADVHEGELAPSPDTPANANVVAAPTPRYHRHWPEWLIGGSGAVAAGLGAYLISIDGTNACDSPLDDCMLVRNTKAAGWVAVIGGSAAVVGAVWLHLSHRSQPRLVAMPLGRGVFGSASWRF